jgi:phage shock protein E
MRSSSIKRFISTIVITMVILAGCASVDPKEATVPEDLDTYSGLSAALASDEDILLYDVRNPEEYDSGHIPGALNVPDYHFLKDIPPSLNRNDIIVLYCVSGLRSTSVHKLLSNNGFNYVYDFGGLWKWEGELAKGTD